MRAILLDTHAWAWTLSDSSELSMAARTAITEAEAVFVSPISFFEIGQKVRLGKWPQMEPYVHDLPQRLGDQGARVAAATPEIFLLASLLDWSHRDPFDRILAATALEYQLRFISIDQIFDTLERPQRLTRCW